MTHVELGCILCEVNRKKISRHTYTHSFRDIVLFKEKQYMVSWKFCFAKRASRSGFFSLLTQDHMFFFCSLVALIGRRCFSITWKIPTTH